ncbi:hypothetical protein GGF32_004735 [Allomyces javanicus]|nr:hypothetical protein GGF32_004735 [Allomyces javanicus]
MRGAKVLGGSSHPDLTEQIVDRLGIQLVPVTFKSHANHEKTLEIHQSIRNQDVFIIQSGSDEINDHLMELLIMINTCRASSAGRITAILPYLPYSKQCKKKKSRGAVTAKLVANMLTVAGVDHIITLDLHHDQMQGFFSKPVDNLLAEPTLFKYVTQYYPDHQLGVVVSKNPGGVKRVTSLSDRLKMDFALIHQDKSVPKPQRARVVTTGSQNHLVHDTMSGESLPQLLATSASTAALDDPDVQVLEVIDTAWHEDGLQLVGDVKGRVAFLVDDMIDAPDTFIAAAKLLLRRGATKVVVLGTHGILSNDALAEFEKASSISEIAVTNSYPIPPEKRAMSTKLRIMDISGVIAEAIRRTHNGESISYLFNTAI